MIPVINQFKCDPVLNYIILTVYTCVSNYLHQFYYLQPIDYKYNYLYFYLTIQLFTPIINYLHINLTI